MKLEKADIVWAQRNKTNVVSGHIVSHHKISDIITSAESIISSRDARIAELEKHNAELVAENDKMKCCGNCENKSGLSGYAKCKHHNADCHG